ncbi:hypothetical protein DL93DRAFT_2082554 [Clavulina sp. PMI_390]|nr:hypothetical protein DL93DRAFT_2082554 [Clavulina sp. PMI_390]
MDQYLFQSLDATTLLPETVDRALMMWICWFSTSWGETLSNEDLHYENKMIQFLRPVNYANFNYNAYFAPWMLYNLPTNTTPETDGYSRARENRYDADIDPMDRSVIITLYGTPLRITPPLLVHAGLLMYFARFEKRSIFESLGMRLDYSSENSGAMSNLSLVELQNASAYRLPNLRNSRQYDGDFNRLVSCLDPRQSAGMDSSYLKGIFSGDWEGRFAFTDFDSFRDMLDGDDEAIHSSTIAQQPQVWSIKEHHYSRSLTSAAQYLDPADDDVDFPDSLIDMGPGLHGFLPDDVHLEDTIQGSRAQSPTSPFTSPPPSPSPTLTATYMDHNSGVPTTKTYITLRTVDPPPFNALRPSGSILHPARHPIPWQMPALKRSMTRSPMHTPDESGMTSGYFDSHWYSSPLTSHSGSLANSSTTSLNSEITTRQVDELNEDDVSPPDIILTGKGHSAWGPFLVKGRVRLWDGMVNLVKSYAGNDGRGTWAYRGYILDGGIWVGRWRDTMTQEDTNGYEGVFAMTKRQREQVEGIS